MKKLIASLLTVATVASMASFTAFAAGDYSATAECGANVYTDTDEALSTNTVKPDKKVYINLNAVSFSDGTNSITGASLSSYLTDKDYFKVKTDKGDDDTKMIKAISVTEKDIVAASTGREVVVKIELNNDTTDKEFKINPSVTFTAKKAIDFSTGTDVAVGDKFTIDLGKVYITNTEQVGDTDWKAGAGGFIAKPVKNDDNEITWEDENDTIAKLTFEGDSDVSKYYPKLSTKWDNADYAENFKDTDAFLRSFVGAPAISATSRPVLELYNPFVNEDDEVTVADEDIVIYEVVDGALVDVTAKFTIGENDDGDSVFTLKTRTLGTYIISNGAATAAEEAPAEEAPSDEKENPGTGRF